MTGKTPTTPPEQTATPTPDPLLMRQQQLQQQLQQTNKQIMDLKQQKGMIEDMIASANNQAQQIVGAMNILMDIMTDPTPPEQK